MDILGGQAHKKQLLCGATVVVRSKTYIKAPVGGEVDEAIENDRSPPILEDHATALPKRSSKNGLKGEIIPHHGAWGCLHADCLRLETHASLGWKTQPDAAPRECYAAPIKIDASPQVKPIGRWSPVVAHALSTVGQAAWVCPWRTKPPPHTGPTLDTRQCYNRFYASQGAQCLENKAGG